MRCGVRNRVPARHLADAGKCGACHGHLPPHHTPVDVIEVSKLDQLIAQVRVPVLIELEPMGGPDRLRMMAAKLAGRALVVRLAARAGAELAARYAIELQPRFLVFRHGRLLQQRSEIFDPAALERWAVESA
jgi:thioredoxin 2